RDLPAPADPVLPDADLRPDPSGTGPAPGTAAPGTATPSTVPEDSAAPASTGATDAPAATNGRCRTSELRAWVGRNNPGAGQSNFPIVLTNTSARVCTVRGYPGAAFLDASGRQLGPDPERSAATPETVTLAPGKSAWAGLSFSSPEVSGARAATPAALLVTPPDERDPLKVTWTAGRVPVSGNEASVRLIPFSPGTGA
ncbi:DUF4232 domain-containing protein, partial [Streptomyces sp. NPDC003011]